MALPWEEIYDGLLYLGFIWTVEGKTKGSGQKPIKTDTEARKDCVLHGLQRKVLSKCEGYLQILCK